MDINKVFAGLPENNKKFIIELMAVFQTISFGTVQPVIELHRNRVMKAEFRGWKRIKYDPSIAKEQAIKDLGQRISVAIKNKQTTKLHFIIDLKNGVINEILWDSYIYRRYDTP